MRKVYQVLLFITLFPFAQLLSAHWAYANPSFTILQYHHVSDKTPPVTSISSDMFAQHMQYLADNHTVISLKEGLDAIKHNQPLPDNAVVITFDDGFANIYENGYPILKQHNFPFVIFVNPDQIGQSKSQLTWAQIEDMSALALYGNHTIGHIHLLNRQHSESTSNWLKRVMTNIEQAEALLSEQVGYSLKWLAYPFGEYNTSLKEALIERGFTGFAQHSGAVGIDTDIGAIPRFPAAGIYANLKTLRVKMMSLPMPIASFAPWEPERTFNQPVHTIKMTLSHQRDLQMNAFACYFQGQSLPINVVDNTITLDWQITPPPGRLRINCTVPSLSQHGRYYWKSIPMFTPTAEGIFLD